jgi:predicted metal-binding transcription factor (methanogenesis marker protein 9)
MSEELTEEEKDVKLLEIMQALSELGENAIANQLFGKIEKKLKWVLLQDWETHQICETFPHVDTRDLVFCCSPSNNCPYRAAVLRKMGLTTADYIDMKRELAEVLEEILEGKIDGKNKSKYKSLAEESIQKTRHT